MTCTYSREQSCFSNKSCYYCKFVFFNVKLTHFRKKAECDTRSCMLLFLLQCKSKKKVLSIAQNLYGAGHVQDAKIDSLSQSTNGTLDNIHLKHVKQVTAFSIYNSEWYNNELLFVLGQSLHQLLIWKLHRWTVGHYSTVDQES